MLADTVAHLLHNVIPAAADYAAAEDALSEAYAADSAPAAWEMAARTAKRRAAELAIAIDGLTDRCAAELGVSKASVRNSIAALCSWPGSTVFRAGAHDRVRGVANVYKHHVLSDPTLPISTEADILVVGLGYGLDGYGVGKFGGLEVLVQERSGVKWKFLGDAPVAVSAWFKHLAANGAVLPAQMQTVCGVQIYS
ncbi:hypothetical protein [Mesorhizobium sp. M4B.F.Ca.ET.058.02.1.1]|uniref:hypothetical protein n=1 Tax=Mesorhizobium sp. M4B.F.Ca.ET.058.02.1.1 TaxID=2493675 RepID=UPI000F74DCA4|nr:hypothetical protein [Mesorhizobium sp. M4B.F.Ca.ET.058.02.1.1]AZO49909.1 hypothetical protein EJ073_20440 [Mesorhizobium sp. M4B.F.Ca.ET.058.02.1.1]